MSVLKVELTDHCEFTEKPKTYSYFKVMMLAIGIKGDKRLNLHHEEAKKEAP